MTASLWPRAVTALVAVLALAGAGCGSDGDGGGSGEARALLARAFDKGPEAGDLALELRADLEGIRSLDGPLRLRLDGPFRSAGAARFPLLDWDVGFDGAGQRLSGGVIATGDNAFLRFQGRAYEVGEEAFRQITQSLPPRERKRPPGLGSLGLDPASWLEDPKVSDGEDRRRAHPQDHRVGGRGQAGEGRDRVARTAPRTRA